MGRAEQWIFGFALAAAAFVVTACDSGVVADRFEVKHRLDGKTLYLTLDTDLPDFPDVFVSVNRDYRQKGRRVGYAIEYFQEASSVGKWRAERAIPLDNPAWKKKLEEEQERMKKQLTPFTVESINEEITINFTIPAKQSDKRMGDQNSKLKGKAVTKASIPIILNEVKIRFPLD